MTDILREQLQATLGSAYVLGSELGGGGMSRVFAADDVALDRSIVVKVLSPDLTAGLNIERFKREIRFAAALQHPHIVPVLQAGEVAGLPYFTMPLAKGRSLATRLADSGRVSIAEGISILRDVAKALEFAHAQGVVHRDIKPGNILIAGNAAVVTDFGIAKALSAARGGGWTDTLTQTGTSLGTPAYMAPEQAAADPLTDHRADIYAFGVVAYELLTGATPFAGKTPQKLLAAQMAERPVPIESVRADVPAPLAALVMQCLEKDASARPQSATDLLRVLETVTTSPGSSVDSRMLRRAPAPRHTALAIYAAACLIVGLAARVATVEIGLPDWVFPAAAVVMLAGLPVVLFTAYVERVVSRQSANAPAVAASTQASTLAALALKASPRMSWARTALGGAIALTAFVLVVFAYMAMRAAGIGPIGSLLGAGTIHERDRIVVTDFRAPGDTSLADVASEAVRTDLGESSVMSLLTPSEVVGILRLMQRPATTRLDVPLATEVATRAGAKAVVDGSIVALGSGYVVNLRLLALSGGELAAFHDAADNPHELLPTLDRLARRLRAKIGESLKTIQADPPLAKVTTPSLEALRKYEEGTRANNVEGDYDRAIAALRQAVALDTGFAMAYGALGMALSNAGRSGPPADSAFTQAYRHRDRLTQREQNLTIAAYFDTGPGQDRGRAAQAYAAVVAVDSLDRSAVQNLALIYETERRYAAAESLLRRLAEGRPAANTLYALARVQSLEGDRTAAGRTGEELRHRFPNATLTPFLLVGDLYDRNQVDSLSTVLSHIQGTGTAGQQALAKNWLQGVAILRGHLAEWPRLEVAAEQANGEQSDISFALLDSITRAGFDILIRGTPARGIARLDVTFSPAALGPAPTKTPQPAVYLVASEMYAMAGRPDRARVILGWYRSEVADSLERKSGEPLMHLALAEIALAEHSIQDAVRELGRSDTASDGQPAGPALYFPMLAGRVYAATGNADSTILMWTRYEAAPRSGDYPDLLDIVFRPLVYERLGELYERKGDPANAIANYEQFITLWRTADPDLQPRVAEARRRIARLAGDRAAAVEP